MADSFTSEYLKRRKERTAQSALSSMATRDYAQRQLASAARSVSTSQTAKIPAQPSSSPSTSRHSAKSAFHRRRRRMILGGSQGSQERQGAQL